MTDKQIEEFRARKKEGRYSVLCDAALGMLTNHSAAMQLRSHAAVEATMVWRSKGRPRRGWWWATSGSTYTWLGKTTQSAARAMVAKLAAVSQ